MKKTVIFNLGEEREFDARLRKAERNAAALGNLRERIIHDGRDYQLKVYRNCYGYAAKYSTGARAVSTATLASVTGSTLGECLGAMLEWQTRFLHDNPLHARYE